MIRTLLIAALLVLAPLPTLAATFCVDTPAELTTALQIASSNGESDQIRLKVGEYAAPLPNGFIVSFSALESLEITGGWSDFNNIPCLVRNNDPRSTIIDGGDTHPLLRATLAVGNVEGNLVIRNLTLRNGRGPDGQNIGAVHFGLPPSNVRILVDRVLFWSNSAYGGAAVTALGMQRLTIRNSAFQFNTVRENSGTVQISLTRDDQRFFFVNNTMTSNTHNGTQATRCSALALQVPVDGTSPEMLVVNNILWGNTDYDLCLPIDEAVHLYHNNIQDQFRSAQFESGNLSVPPQLAPQLLDITPLPGSPMIDAGLTEPPPLLDPPLPIEDDWGYGDLDFNGLVSGRVVGEGVDIGAAESTFIDRTFCDGFQLEGACPQ
jgi:hypothetical protein